MRYALFVVALLGVLVRAQPTDKVTFLQEPQVYCLHVISDIRNRYAHTLMTSRVANPTGVPQEVTFTVVLPGTAFISGFLIEDDGQVYEAYVRSKEAAQKEYTEAVRKGKTTAHVALSARDSNRFTVSVNVEPLKKVTFNLTYEELLSRTLGEYKHVINLDPGQIVPDLSVVVRIEESSDITALNVPALRVSNEIDSDPTSGKCCNPLAIIKHITTRSAVVKWAPTPKEQLELASDGVRGQLVVKYDVDRLSHPYQILVNDGYFVHFFAPEDLPPLRKQVTFVLDVSGSMEGRKLHQLKEAMYTILSDLRPTDFFSLVIFASRTKVWCSSSARFAKLRKKNSDCQSAMVPATRENVENAKLAVNTLEATGATNIHKAMKTAIQVSRLGKRIWKISTSSDDLARRPRHPEPIIIFLTDGEPTEGKTEPEKIISATTRWNKKCKASIFTLTLGDEADMAFLKKLSLRNYGFARKIYEASDTALQLRDFYLQVASPLLANVTFDYHTDQVEAISLTKNRFFSFYSGSELVVAGRLRPAIPGHELRYEVHARSSSGMTQFDPEEPPVVIEYQPLGRDSDDHSSSLMERVWAYLSIQQLLDRAQTNNVKESALKKQALLMALKYSFVTPVTSLVVVKPNGKIALRNVETETQPEYKDIPEFDEESAGPYESLLEPHYRSSEVSNIAYNSETSLRDLFLSGDIQSLHISDETDRKTSLVDFNDIDWLSAFTVGSKILLPFGNSTVEVSGHRDLRLQQLNVGCKTPEGEFGFCRHLRLCPLSSFTQNFTVYLQYFCTLDDRFAGACCPISINPHIS